MGTRAWYSDGEAAGLPRPTCRFSPSETVDQAVETYGLQKITLLREISLKTGIQVGMTRGPSCAIAPAGFTATGVGWEGGHFLTRGGSSGGTGHLSRG